MICLPTPVPASGMVNCTATSTGWLLDGSWVTNSITVTDTAGNMNANVSAPVLVIDDTSPATPSATTSPSPANNGTNIITTVTWVEPGATVTITDPAWNTNTWTTTGLEIDNTNPWLPTAIVPTTWGPVIWTVEPLSIVVLVTPSWSTCTTTADESGNYSCTLSPTPIHWEDLIITSSDSSGNSTSTIETEAIDLQAPLITAWTLTTTTTETTATILWETDESTSTEVVYGLTSVVDQTTWEKDVSPRVTSHTASIENLLSCTTYFYQTISRDAAWNETIDGTHEFETWGCVWGSNIWKTQTTDVIPDSAWGQVILTDTSTSSWWTQLEITLPVWYNSSHSICPVWTYFQLKELDKVPVIQELWLPEDWYTWLNTYELSAYCDQWTRVTEFDKSVTVTMAYTQEDTENIREYSLNIYRFNTILSDWEELHNCSIDESSRTVTCETTQFSTFAIFGDKRWSSWSVKHMDVCNETEWDFSGDYYDGKCTSEEGDESSEEEAEEKNEDEEIDTLQSTWDILTENNDEISDEASLENEVISDEYTLENNFESCPIISHITNPDYQYDTTGVFIDEQISNYRDEILKFKAIGIVDGYDDGTFKPFQEMTRTEFLKVALISHCYTYRELEGNTEYSDMMTSTWQARVVEKAQSLGMINGDISEDGSKVFRPDDIITKAEAVKILMRLSLIKATNPEPLSYTDITVDWHEQYVRTGQTLWIFDPSETNKLFSPDGWMSREDMVNLITNLVHLYK